MDSLVGTLKFCINPGSIGDSPSELVSNCSHCLEGCNCHCGFPKNAKEHCRCVSRRMLGDEQILRMSCLIGSVLSCDSEKFGQELLRRSVSRQRGTVNRFLALISTNAWTQSRSLRDLMRPLMLALCSRYILFEKRKGDPRRMRDPVVNFHTSNGAEVGRINFLGDPSDRGMKSGFGMMCNYR